MSPRYVKQEGESRGLGSTEKPPKRHQVTHSCLPWSEPLNGKTYSRAPGQAGNVRTSIRQVVRFNGMHRSWGHMCTVLRYKLKSPAVVPVCCQNPLRLITSPYVQGWLAFTWQKNQGASRHCRSQCQSHLHDYKHRAALTSEEGEDGEKMTRESNYIYQLGMQQFRNTSWERPRGQENLESCPIQPIDNSVALESLGIIPFSSPNLTSTTCKMRVIICVVWVML